MRKLSVILFLCLGCGQPSASVSQTLPIAASNGITPVQFCPNTTTYPTTFSEVAFCIDNNLYAVYSENDGFLSLIPPGNYISNGINSTCTFHVLPNCIVLGGGN